MEMNSKKKYLIIGISAIVMLLASMLIYTFASADDVGRNKLKVKTASITSVQTGSGYFDSNDGITDNTSVEGYIAGNDSSQDNRIVRSFDTISYSFDFNIVGKENGFDASERTVDINVELTPEEAKYVLFEADGEPGNTTYTYHFEGIDTYGPFTKSITLYVLGAPNGTEINPKFIIKEQTDEEAGVSLGKISSTADYYGYNDGNYNEQATFQNYLPSIVSSTPAVIKMDTTSTGENQKATYDGKVGRYITFVSGLYIEGNGEKGIKGYDMPTGDISFIVNLSQDGNSSVITKEEWARLYSINNVDSIEAVTVGMPYSTADSNKQQKEVRNAGNLTINKVDNAYGVIVKDYNIVYKFPLTNADDSSVENRYYIGTYAFTAFSPRSVEDGKDTINVNYGVGSITANGVSGETYSIDNSNASNTNEYYQSGDHSYDSAFYTEDDKRINSDSSIGSLSKGSYFIYKTTFDYKKTQSDEGLREVIKVNPNAFRVVNYSTRYDEIVNIDVKCGEENCSTISKDDFEVKLISGDFTSDNYSLGEISQKISQEDRDSVTSACSNLNISGYTSDQIMNIYGGPCIKANDGVEEIYSSLEDAANADGSEIKITKVVVQTKEGISLPDNATVTVKVKLRVRDVADLTRTYQVSSVISTSEYNNVLRYYYPSATTLANPDNYRIPTINGNNVDVIDNVSYADSLRVANFTSRQEITVVNKNSDGNMKVNFNAVDNENIVFNIKPIVEDNSQNVKMDDVWFIKSIILRVKLPKELTFIPDADDKYLVGSYSDGEDTYLTFRLPFSKSNFVLDNVSFKTKLNPKLKGSGVPIEITSNMFAFNVNEEQDNSLFGETTESFTIYGNGVDNVLVEQKVGSAGTSVEKNTEFSYLLSAYNNTNNLVEDYSLVDILPANEDGRGTKFSGEYQVKLNVPSSLASAKIYCSTQPFAELAEDIDNSRNEWSECPDLTEGYKSVTAIKFSNINMAPGAYTEPIEIVIKPTNNSYSDRYNNYFVGGSTSYSKNKSNTISVGVVSRSISGRVFKDNNENGIQDENDNYVSGIPATLYRVENEESTKISETVTDGEGRYEFKDLDVGKYYIDLNYNGAVYDLTRRYATMDEKIDSDAYKVSDEVARISNKKVPDDPFGIRLTREDISLENYDMGLIPRRIFGFDIKKYITKIDLNYNGTSDVTEYNNETKVSISVKNSLRATAKVYYGIAITNNSSRPGYVNQVEESIPEGLLFDQSIPENKDWITMDGKLISTALSNTVIYPGETKYLQIVLFMPTRESAGTFLNTVSILEMTEYEETPLPEEAGYTNAHGYVIGESVDYAGISWHVINTENMDDGSQKVTLLADSGSITTNMSHTSSEGSVYKWSDSMINHFLMDGWSNNSLDKSVLYDISICDDASGLEGGSFAGSITGTCLSNIYASSKIRLLTSEEYSALITSHLSNINWLTGNGDYWLQSGDSTLPVHRLFGTEPSDSYGDISSHSTNKASYVSSTGIKTTTANTSKEVRPVITISSNNILFE